MACVVYANHESLQPLNRLLEEKMTDRTNPSQYMCVQGNCPARTCTKQG